MSLLERADDFRTIKIFVQTESSVVAARGGGEMKKIKRTNLSVTY
jgi:hypothetical protein